MDIALINVNYPHMQPRLDAGLEIVNAGPLQERVRFQRG